jgi:hypothetical protein
MTHTAHHHSENHPDPADQPPPQNGQTCVEEPVPSAGRRGFAANVWSGLTAVVGAVMGLVPHALHHVSVFAGAVLVTGVGGNLAFGVLGLLFSIPLLRRLYRRFRTWKAPAAALVVFATMFSLSAFVIGPAISGDDEPARTPVPGQSVSPEEHAQHHD